VKIYLAARYTRNKEMQDVAGLLEKYGHYVTSRWHTGVHSMDDGVEPDSGAGKAQAAQFAQEDLDDLMEANCVISFTEAPRTPTRGGRHAEFGYGLAYQKRMVIVGQREMIFHYLPQVTQFDTLEDLMKWIPRKAEAPKPDTDGASGALFSNEPSGAAAAIAGR
jgi:nucleoside 2-deoxyribosyltransferase